MVFFLDFLIIFSFDFLSYNITIIIHILTWLDWVMKFRPIFKTHLTYSNITIKIFISSHSNHHWTYLTYITNIILIFKISFFEYMAIWTFKVPNRERSAVTTIKFITFVTYYSWHTHLSTFSTFSSDKSFSKYIEINF